MLFEWGSAQSAQSWDSDRFLFVLFAQVFCFSFYSLFDLDYDRSASTIQSEDNDELLLWISE